VVHGGATRREEKAAVSRSGKDRRMPSNLKCDKCGAIAKVKGFMPVLDGSAPSIRLIYCPSCGMRTQAVQASIAASRLGKLI